MIGFNDNDLLTGEKYTVGDKVLAAIGAIGFLTGGVLVKEKSPGKTNTGNKNPNSTSAITDNEAGYSSVDNAGKGEVSNKVVKGSLAGKSSKIYEQSTPDNQRSIKRENDSARILANNGYNVEQNPVSTNTKNTDYKINGEIFDNYAPTTNNPRNIWTAVKTKVKEEQTQNVVINLADSKVNIDALKKQFVDWKVEGLNKIVIINKYHDIIKLQ